MTERVFVTGVGIISAIGNNCKEAGDALTGLKSGIRKISLLETIYKEELPVAEVNANPGELKEMAEVGGKRHFSRTSLLGLVAAKQALSQSHSADLKDYRNGLISATTVGGMDRSEQFYKEFQKNNKSGMLC